MADLLPDTNGVVPTEAEHNAAIETASQVDEDALVEKISGAFADVFDDGNDDPQDPDNYDDEVEDTDDLEDEQDDEDDGSAADEYDEDPDDGSDAGEQGTRPSDAPTISTAHERSLAANHTADEIKQLRKSLGKEGFTDYAARMHEKRNAETARMAELGRLAQALNPQGQPGTNDLSASEQQARSAQPQGQPGPIKPIDVAALRDKFGDDELIDEFSTALNSQAAALNAMLAAQEQAQVRVQRNEQESLIRQIDEFFGGNDLAAYADHYGSSVTSLNPEQETARTRVLEMADALMTGAQFQGRNLTVGQALSAAHDALSVDVTEATVRRKVKKEAKRRNRGISRRPSSRRTSDGRPDLSRKGAPKDDRELQARTRTRMRQVFGN